MSRISFLEAEILLAQKDYDGAITKFEMCIMISKKGELWNELGMACERSAVAARLQSTDYSSGTQRVVSFLELAADAYDKWNAVALVEHIHEKIERMESVSANMDSGIPKSLILRGDKHGLDNSIDGIVGSLTRTVGGSVSTQNTSY